MTSYVMCSKCLTSAPSRKTHDELVADGWRLETTRDGHERWWCPECKDKPMTIPKRGKGHPHDKKVTIQMAIAYVGNNAYRVVVSWSDGQEGNALTDRFVNSFRVSAPP